MTRRFYTPPPLATGVVTLDDVEAHHLSTVMRAAVGDVIELFDGRGRVADGTVSLLRKREVDVTVGAVRQEPRAASTLTIATAVPKGERFDWLIEKASELGVTRLVPLVTERSTVEPRESKLDRLRQLVVSACKQSGRNWLMEIAPVTPWREFVASIKHGQPFLVAAPEGKPWSDLMEGDREAASEWFIAIGPEGGWTPGELDLARDAGAMLVSLGPHILRIETAVLAVAAAWRLKNRLAPA
jgi:16S rRNA (uracil1498-N3)-methyltransferase